MAISLSIKKKLGDFTLDVSFETGDDILALLGASGSGKSLTLKCVAGIETPDSGHIVVDGLTLFDSKQRINLSPQERKTGFLFQNYALFPNMTARENIKAGARREKDPKKREEMVGEMMASFGLSALADRYPAQLSGGEQQRVALARILVSNPNILMLDEPFSALDSHLRFKLEQEVGAVMKAFGKTVLLVSHDRDEVFRLSDRIAIMDGGRVLTLGGKKEVFANPKTRSGAVLTGCKNISRAQWLSDSQVRLSDFGLTLRLPHRAPSPYLGIRMHDIQPAQVGAENAVVCQVVCEIENPFSYTILLTPKEAPGKKPFGWEMEKPVWQALRAPHITVCLPEDKVLSLKED